MATKQGITTPAPKTTPQVSVTPVRHPDSARLDRLATHAPEAASFRLRKIDEDIGDHELFEFQLTAKPGDYFVNFWTMEKEGDLECQYWRVQDATEEQIAAFSGEKKPFFTKFYLLRLVDIFDSDTKECHADEPTTAYPWDLHIPLTPAQFEYLKEQGFPRWPHELFAALCGVA